MEIDFETIRRQAHEQVAERMSAFTETIDAIARTRDAAARLTASASSRDGMVEVWVNASGTVIRLDLDDDAFREYTPETLSAEIVEVTQQAARSVRHLVETKTAEIREMASSAFGSDSGPVDIPELEDLRRAVVPSTSDPEADDRWRR
ncbi:YbaB/EbfC family nucleoid-associated protein [Williamsia sp. SKLECPSW1]